ncbi:MAG: L-serine ammonia-lyase, iron-sulfur-dependent, subunit alpha [Oscillospiraceae bacterium]|nr:L-serine ammonia-lyase, iron-sulfur-dependent, subunit alpha [Oscillospiraceae bacterium]
MNLDSMKELISASIDSGTPIWELVIEAEQKNRGVSREDSFEKMNKTWQAMLDASENYSGERRSMSGLVGGQGERMRTYAANHQTIGGDFTSEIIAEALAMGESNACMCRIVAAPTAGACGVMPAVLIPLWRREKISTEQMIQAMFVASGIGAVLAYRACISGAAGGCQAEVGSASAMAAGALVTLRGGSAEQVGHAVAMALKNLLGLVCDPVAGLVEVPCVKRNVIGAMNAIAAADMALAGIESRIPVDEVIDTMGDVGRRLPVEFRETALGGLAATPTGKAVRKQMIQSQKKILAATSNEGRVH